MHEIKCPKCGEVFTIDEASYADILQQVRTNEFNREIEDKLVQIQRLHKSELESVRKENELAMHERLSAKEKQVFDAKTNIALLNAQLQTFEDNKKLEINQAILEKEKAIYQLQTTLDQQEKERLFDKANMKEKYENELKLRDETIAFYKDFKAKQSTKMIGESLEQHCEIEFNKLRMTAFPNAFFGKDNDIKTGSKGDYIYREYDESKNEIISIMFEMKNEEDQTSTKKKNEHFFKELDKDRREKQCEYAILVSLLEQDNELYNNGIVDVSYEYEKMYVIRPQFFIPIITLLRNAAMNSLKYKQEIAYIREQNIDITHFEDDLITFKTAFAKNYDIASRKFKNAIEEIDKTILHLQKTKDALVSSENNLRLANNKAEDLTVKKLVHKNATMKRAFDALKDK